MGDAEWKTPGDDALPVELLEIDGLAGDTEPVVLRHFHGLPARVCSTNGRLRRGRRT